MPLEFIPKVQIRQSGGGVMNFQVRPSCFLPSGATSVRDMSIAVCKWKQRCSKCGGEHRYGDCDNAKDNCGRQHRVTYGGCEVRRKDMEIEIEVKEVHSISCIEAVKN